MQKYAPLKGWLEARTEQRLRVSFAEMEAILGFELPRSARLHRPWWANSFGAHVQAAAWLDAGWQTAEVDLAGETLVFVRADEPAYPIPPASVSGVEEGDPAMIMIPRESLTPGAMRLLRDCAEELGSGLEQAAVLALNAAALDRRRRLVEEFRALAPPQATDSTLLIREDRDGR